MLSNNIKIRQNCWGTFVVIFHGWRHEFPHLVTQTIATSLKTNSFVSRWLQSSTPCLDLQQYDFDFQIETVVTADCLPVFDIAIEFLDDPYDYGSLVTSYYFNMQTSISDPTVFNLPDYCQTPGLKEHRSKRREWSFLKRAHRKPFVKSLSYSCL